MKSFSGHIPKVAIIMPALNEENYIVKAIDSIRPDASKIDYTIYVADGGSTDATPEILSELSRVDPRIKCVHNEKKIQSSAVNKVSRILPDDIDYILRADCHAAYPPDFAKICIDALIQRDAASVVVPMRTVGSSPVQKAIAAAQNSRLGNGGAQHRVSTRSGYVDHGHHAAFVRSIFNQLGGYDENLSHNEDAEYDNRLLSSGYKIWLEVDAMIDYFPRSDFSSLSRQYRKFGSGRAETWMKHRYRLKIRQILPVLILIWCAISLLLSVVSPLFIIGLISYLGSNFTWALILAIKNNSPPLILAGFAFTVMHLSWGFGFLQRLTVLAKDKYIKL